ncbi:DUF3090 family protein [Aeromicrobium sp. UC242_57]|uniref:DUF3090 family protein n=1 Tax=Aeromicrobium sp. UC242_57 TaxID=3374624 RepID=UPI003794A96A
MPQIVHGFDWPDRFVVGTVGQPGDRTFYLQARAGSKLISVSLEKQQSAALAERVEEVLDELMAVEGNPFSVPAITPEGLVDNDPLEQPVEEEFRAGTMTLGWDPTTSQLVIEAFPIIEIEVEVDDLDQIEDLDQMEIDLEVEPPEVLVIRIPVGTARAFAKRTREVVGAGRPLCPLCRLPMDSDDHVCELPRRIPLTTRHDPEHDLLTGDIVLEGRIMSASNATFVGTIGDVTVVYKPVAGEQPLWDFPDGNLAHREVAAYLVSEVLGWDVVPRTWLRDGPMGPRHAAAVAGRRS